MMLIIFVLLTVAAVLGTTTSEPPGEFGPPAGWVAVQRGSPVHVNPDNHPIQIKSTAGRGSLKAIVVDFLNSGHAPTHARVIIFLGYTERYVISECNGSFLKPFPVVPPTAAERIWTIAKSSTHLTISCNGVTLVEKRLDDAIACEVEWGVKMDHISFPSSDTGSEFYYLNEGDSTAPYLTCE
uniref:Putative secretory peptide-46 n=1 Tax=Pleurobrachia bachei TaxID=34499 RepID=M4H266_PLEBA|nr:putative secretory peptide-46 [Pleurobrachia bachei]|eukprot:sb/3471551/